MSENDLFVSVRDWKTSVQTGISLDAHATIRFPHFTVLVCGFLKVGQLWHQKPLPNPFWRLYYNFESGNDVLIGDQRFALGPDTVWIFPTNLMMGYEGFKDVPHLWIHFMIEPPFLFSDQEPLAISMDATLQAAIGSLLAHYDQANTQWQHLHRLYHLSSKLLHECFARIALEPRPPIPLKLQSLLQWIKHNPTGDLSNAFLAHLVQMSREGFIRWFKQNTGMTPGRYVRQMRIDHSCSLLIGTDQSVEQIAETCGFPNRHYFSRVFAHSRGCGPAQFRKQNHII